MRAVNSHMSAMSAQRKVYRVETFMRRRNGANGPDERTHSHDEVMEELRALRTLIQPREDLTQSMIEAYKAEIGEAQKLKAELDLIYDAINKTKHEIATLHLTGF